MSYELNPSNILEDKSRYAIELHKIRERRLIIQKRISRTRNVLQTTAALEKAYSKKIARIDKMFVDIETRMEKLEAKLTEIFGEE